MLVCDHSVFRSVVPLFFINDLLKLGLDPLFLRLGKVCVLFLQNAFEHLLVFGYLHVPRSIRFVDCAQLRDFVLAFE